MKGKRLTTDEDLGLVAEGGWGQVLCDEVGVDASGGASPARFGLVEGVDDIQGVGVLALESVKLFLHEDVLLRDVGEDEGEAGLVGGVLEGVVEDLVHRRAVNEVRGVHGDDEEKRCIHAASTSNHADLVKLVDCQERDEDVYEQGGGDNRLL